MTSKEYQASRAQKKKETAEKVVKSFKRHYKPELKSKIWLAKVMKDCNVSKVTVYDAIEGLL